MKSKPTVLNFFCAKIYSIYKVGTEALRSPSKRCMTGELQSCSYCIARTCIDFFENQPQYASCFWNKRTLCFQKIAKSIEAFSLGRSVILSTLNYMGFSNRMSFKCLLVRPHWPPPPIRMPDCYHFTFSSFFRD